MTGDLVTLFNRKGPNSPVVAIELKRDEAEHALARWPFAWSRSETFAPWPWPAMARRGEVVELPSSAAGRHFGKTS